MIKKTLKHIGITFFFYVFLCSITPYIHILKNRSIKNQINYLSEIIDKGYDNTLQKRFPEGKVFSNAILALATIEYYNSTGRFGNKYSAIVDNCIKRIQSKKTMEIFNSSLNPKYGMFYNAWSNLVYSKYKVSQLYKYSKLRQEVSKSSSEIEQRIFKTQCDSLRLLDSYAGANWPADNLIGICSISIDSLKEDWIETIFDDAKHKSGLIHHVVSNKSEVRGSSNAMIIYCLGQSGYKNVKKYNEVYQSVFIDEYLGIQLVKENESGSNKMDIDSGPVVFGYGAAATIMNIKAQASLGNSKSKLTWGAMNTVALPINMFEKKYYLLKNEPMLDLFMLWASTEL